MTERTTVRPVYAFIASYLSWAREARIYGTLLPAISYRGHAHIDWQLLPSLCRQKASWASSEQYTQLLKQKELEIVNEFQNRFGLNNWKDMEVLAYAQHHGAPTRLLDWSTNPFIALWFAVSEKRFDEFSGNVFQLNVTGSDDFLTISYCENISLKHTGNMGLKAAIKAPCSSPSNIDRECNRPIHVFNSSRQIDRTDRQRSVFTITTFDKGYATQPLDQILKESKNSLRIFPVPKELKKELRSLLTSLGLDPYSMFGDPDSFGKYLSVVMDLPDFQMIAEPDMNPKPS